MSNKMKNDRMNTQQQMHCKQMCTH